MINKNISLKKFLVKASVLTAGAFFIMNAALAFLSPAPKPSFTTKTISYATGTRPVPAYTVYTLDATGENQGVCLKIRDGSGAGWTYLTVENGIGMFGTASCE